jgi:hypothetical protein
MANYDDTPRALRADDPGPGGKGAPLGGGVASARKDAPSANPGSLYDDVLKNWRQKRW